MLKKLSEIHLNPDNPRKISNSDEYVLTGNFKDQWNRLGNAVMPKMMYHIAKHIKETILENYEKA